MIKKTKKSPLASIETAVAPGPPIPAKLTLPRFGSLWRLGIYPMAVLVPGAGVVLGLLYARQEDKEARNFGRICLALGVLGAMLRLGGGYNASEPLNQPLY